MTIEPDAWQQIHCLRREAMIDLGTEGVVNVRCRVGSAIPIRLDVGQSLSGSVVWLTPDQASELAAVLLDSVRLIADSEATS